MSLADDLLAFNERLDGLEDGLSEHYGKAYRPLPLERASRGVPEDLLTVGLVGGTGVGKSSLVNALAGRDVSRASSRRPTTARAIPYLHEERVSALAEMAFIRDHLSESRGLHRIDELRSLALFDLPDIDSVAEEHGRVVEAAAEGLDLVVWIASLTKYSDREFHEWIRRHAGRIDLANAIFVLNKIDRIDEADGDAARRELRDRYAAVLCESLGLPEARRRDLRIFLVSAHSGDDAAVVPGNELDAFRDELFRERDTREILRIKASNRLADADRRLRHVRDFLDLEERRGRLDGEVSAAREELERALDAFVLQSELERIIETSHVPAELTTLHYRRAIRSWPLLARLTFLAAPLRRSFAILRQLQRLTGLDEAADGAGEEASSPLLGALEAVQHARRRHRSRRASLATEQPFSPKDRPAMAKDLHRFRGECDEALSRALEERRRTDAGDPPAPGWIRRLLVYVPLFWFPFLQPLVRETLDPASAGQPLLHRLAFRLVEVAGATHLIVSLLFVALVYAIIILVLRGLAARKAQADCRRVLESDSWRKVMRDRLEGIALEDLETDRLRLERESRELSELDDESQRLRRILDVQ